MRTTVGQARGRRGGRAGAGLPLVALLAACGPPPPAAAPPRDLDAEARGAATTLMHCYERDGAECRHADAPYRSWYALRALLVARDRSPVALLAELPRALEALRDDRVARRTFIGQLTAHEPLARTGQCTPTAVRPLGGAITALAAAAGKRIEELGLGDTAAGGHVGELGEAAASLREAREVRLSCAGGRSLHLVLAPTPDGGWHPVRLGDEPVAVGAAGGAAPEPAVIAAPTGVGLDPWLPFGETEL